MERLDLGANHVGAEGAAVVAVALLNPRTSALRELDLSANDIGAGGGDAHVAGARDDSGTLMDKVLFGGRSAFAADASEWQTMLWADRKILPNGWIQETCHKRHLLSRNVSIRREPMAYCIVSAAGSCRFGAELARSLTLIGRSAGNALLQLHPQLCAMFTPRQGAPFAANHSSATDPAPCNPKRKVQAPFADQERDPGFCGLAARCMRRSDGGRNHSLDGQQHSACQIRTFGIDWCRLEGWAGARESL